MMENIAESSYQPMEGDLGVYTVSYFNSLTVTMWPQLLYRQPLQLQQDYQA